MIIKHDHQTRNTQCIGGKLMQCCFVIFASILYIVRVCAVFELFYLTMPFATIIKIEVR